MTRRPRVHWRLLDGTDETAVWTPGWLPDSGILRWSLANDLRVEGLRDGWHESYTWADAADVVNGYVAEDDFGDVVEVTHDGETVSGTFLTDVQPATIARLVTPAPD